MAKIVVRPTSTKGLVLLGEQKVAPTITVNGKTVTGTYLNTEVDRGTGKTLHQYQFPGVSGGEVTNGVINYAGETSPALNFSGGQFEYRTDNGNLSSLGQSPNKAMYGGSSGPMMMGQYGFAPGYVPYPGATFGSFNSIAGANYKPKNAIKFAKKYGEFNRGEITKNADLANQLALDQLDLELEGLKRYAPEATALRMQENQKLSNLWRDETAKNEQLRLQTIRTLSDERRTQISENEDLRREQIGINADLKRDLISEDNIFNQSERTAQINRALPGVNASLESQAARAAAFAEGRVPDEVINNGLSIANRSRAADAAAVGGFGRASGAARNINDVLDATTRIGLSQYGDSLLTNNIGTRAALNLAPTQYSDAGGQVRIEPNWSSDVTFSTDAAFGTGAGFSTESGISSAPSVSIAGLASSNLGMYNAATMISTGDAYSSRVQQEQFGANLDQRTQEFNAQGEFQESMGNAGIANQFALGSHGYNVGYQGALAGATQTDLNTGMALQQQAQAQDAFVKGQGAAQTAGTIGSVAQLAGALGTIIRPTSQTATVPDSSGGVYTPAGVDYSGTSGSTFIPSSGQSYPSGISAGGGIGSAVIPSGGSIPSGYAGVASLPDGGTLSIPVNSSGMSGSVSGGGAIARSAVRSSQGSSGQPVQVSTDGQQVSAGQGISTGQGTSVASRGFTTDPAVSSFSKETGVKVSEPQASYLNSKADGVLNMSGFYSTPVQGTQPVGVTGQGQPLYASRSLLNSSNTESGGQLTRSLSQQLNPYGILSDDDRSSLDTIADIAEDTSLVATLTSQYQQGDKKGFINTILGKFQQPLIKSLTDDPSSQQGLGTAFSAYQLYNAWDRMSPAQKSLGLAGVGLQGYQYTTGEDLASKMVISPTGPDSPYLTVGGALNLASLGVNTYSLVNNWGQLNDIQKVAGGTASMAQIANQLQSMNLLGYGTTGAAVEGVTAQTLASQGWGSASTYGVGAISAPAGTAIPAGYEGIANTASGEVIAAPTANAASAQGATSLSAGSVLSTAAGTAGVALGAKTVIDNWGGVEGGSRGDSVKAGAIGGASIAGGLYALGATNPFLLAGVVAFSVIATSTGTGKGKDQQARDGIRNNFQAYGLIDSTDNITLADGSKFNIGLDGSGGKHSITNPELLSSDHKNTLKELHAYDIDYTNDLDYSAGMGGLALARLLSGGKNQAIDQIGNQLGNGALGNVGYGKEMNAQNFNTVMGNLKSQFAQAGIKSKSDAYQISNEAYAQGRLNDIDLVTTQQAINMIFDGADGYATAQKLMAGRFKGIEAATAPEKTFGKGAKPIDWSKPKEKQPVTQEDYVQRNMARYNNQVSTVSAGI